MMPKTQNRKDNHGLRRVCIVREICVLRLIPNGRRGVVTEQDRGHMTDCLVHDSGLRTSMGKQGQSRARGFYIPYCYPNWLLAFYKELAR